VALRAERKAAAGGETSPEATGSARLADRVTPPVASAELILSHPGRRKDEAQEGEWSQRLNLIGRGYPAPPPRRTELRPGHRPTPGQETRGRPDPSIELEDVGWERDDSAIIMVSRRPSSCHCAITSAPRSLTGGRGMVSTADGP